MHDEIVKLCVINRINVDKQSQGSFNTKIKIEIDSSKTTEIRILSVAAWRVTKSGIDPPLSSRR